MGVGIAVEFAKRYDMKMKLLDTFKYIGRNMLNEWELHPKGYCIKIENVFNLVKKNIIETIFIQSSRGQFFTLVI